MLVHPGNHIGDSWYHVSGDVAHCFYLTCPDNVERHTAWDIAHATSRDLANWELHGIVLERGADDEWDGDCLATGSVLKVGPRYWMAYTGRWSEPRVATGLAVSDDLHRWKKAEFNPITTIDPRFYEPIGTGSRRMAHWRDPFLFQHDGYVYQYVCASRPGPDEGRGTLGVARTRDMTVWDVLPPPELDPVAEELECPQIRKIGDRYFLVFSAFPDLFAPRWRAEFGDHLRPGTYAMVGPSPFGPFHLRHPAPIVPEDHDVHPYAGQLVEFRGRWYLLGTVWDDEAFDYICDPIGLLADGDRVVPTAAGS